MKNNEQPKGLNKREADISGVIKNTKEKTALLKSAIEKWRTEHGIEKKEVQKTISFYSGTYTNEMHQSFLSKFIERGLSVEEGQAYWNAFSKGVILTKTEKSQIKRQQNRIKSLYNSPARIHNIFNENYNKENPKIKFAINNIFDKNYLIHRINALNIPSENKLFLATALQDLHNPNKQKEYWDSCRPREQHKNGIVTPTCAGAVNTWLQKNNLKSQNSLLAKDYLNGRQNVALSQAIPGDLVIYDRTGAGTNINSGHIAVFMGYLNGVPQVLSENVPFYNKNNYGGPIIHGINDFGGFSNPRFVKL